MYDINKEERDKFIQELYEKYSKDVYKFIFYKINNSFDAEDILQDVMNNTYIHYKKCINHPNPLAWLYNSSNYFIRKYKRKLVQQNRFNIVSLETQYSEPRYEEPQYTMEEYYENDFENFSKFLNKDQIDLLRLRDIQGYSLKEIAEIKGVSYNTLTVRFWRIYEKIRKNLGDKYK